MTTKILRNEYLLPIVIVSGIILFIFRSLIVQFEQSILDGIDYPLYAWILQTGIANLSSVFRNGFFYGNAFYPFSEALLFSDTFYPLSLSLLPLSFVFRSPFQIVNSGMLLTLFLNVVFASVFTKNYSSTRLSHTILTLMFSISPYLFTQLSHLQMLSFWPIYILLSLLHLPASKKTTGLIAIVLTLQWYLSVYLGTMGLVILTIWWGIDFLTLKTRVNFIQNVVITGALFLVFTGPLLNAYRVIRNTFQAIPDAGMYVDYAAQPTDYFFTRGYTTVASSISFFKQWNTLNHRGAGEPARWIGFSMLILVGTGIIVWRKTSSKELQKLGWLALTLTSLGFVFSLGTRLTLNGTHTGFPLPYLVVLKLFPFLSFFRSPSRWYFLFILGCCLFTCIAIQNLSRSKRFRKWILALGILYAVETLPLHIAVTPLTKPSYVQWLSQSCRPEDVLLSLPIFNYHDSALIALDPSVTSQLMMWTVNSSCRLVNGYSGILPTSLKELDLQTKKNLNPELMKLLKEQGITMLLIKQISGETLASFSKDPDVQLLHQDQIYSLWRVLPNQKK